jgi:Holliday junction resolvase RusA-like endonuclease
MKITIPEKPIPKARPRFTKRGFAYSSQKKEETAIKLLIKSMYKEEPMECALEIEVIFYMPIPKGTSNRKKLVLAGQYHTKRPDLDNLEKFIVDSMNGIVFKDDSQIALSSTMKIYGLEPRTEITVKGLNIDKEI